MPVTEIGTPWRVYTFSLRTLRVRVFREILGEDGSPHCHPVSLIFPLTSPHPPSCAPPPQFLCHPLLSPHPPPPVSPPTLPPVPPYSSCVTPPSCHHVPPPVPSPPPPPPQRVPSPLDLLQTRHHQHPPPSHHDGGAAAETCGDIEVNGDPGIPGQGGGYDTQESGGGEGDDGDSPDTTMASLGPHVKNISAGICGETPK